MTAINKFETVCSDIRDVHAPTPDILKGTFQVLLLIVLATCTMARAADVSRDQLVAVYLYRLAENIHWAGQSQVDRYHFHVVDESKGSYRKFKGIVKNKKLHGKSIRVTYSASADIPSGTHLVYVSQKKSGIYHSVFERVEGRNTLLISDNYENKRIIMINLVETREKQLHFEINKANIINQNLGLNPDIILLGGTEIDVAKLYKEVRISVRKQERQLADLDAKRRTLEALLEKVQQESAGLEKKLAEQRALLAKQEEKAKEQERLIQEHKQAVAKEQARLINAEARTREQQKIIDEHRAQIIREQGRYEKKAKEQERLIQEHKQAVAQEQARLINAEARTREQQKIIDEHRAQIIREQGRYKELALKNTEQQRLIEQQRTLVENERQKYEKLSEDVNRREAALLEQTKQIEGRSVILAEQDRKIKSQEKTILAQDTVLAQQSGIIAGQRYFLYALGAVVLLVGILTLTIFQGYRNKKRSNALLKKQKQLLEQNAGELFSANQRLKELDQLKGEFLANMSHEIRTPMNAVTGMAHLLGQTTLSPQQQRYMRNIHMASNSLLGIVNDILDFSKIEAGKLKLETIEFSLNRVLTNLSNMVSAEAQEKGLEMIINTSTDTPFRLVGDPLRLEQVLVNLTKNAVKFTNQGEVVVSSELIEKENDCLTLQFSVRDTGIGLTQEQMSKLFEAFSQADTTTTRIYGGTGLGLVISKRLVEMMGGALSVKSEAGKGSTFSFTVQFGIKDQKRSRFRLPTDDMAGMRVLVADDNLVALKVLKNYLESFTFTVTAVESGEAAIQELQRAEISEQNPYKLVLMDWKMPGMSGIETTRRIKGDIKIAQKPCIIMITAYGRELALEATNDMGFDGFLVKPVTQSDLFDVITGALGYQAGEDQKPGHMEVGVPTELDCIAGTRVLLVEDNEINQEVAIGLLENAGLLVTVADNGREAVDMVRDKGREALRQKKGLPFDIVLMDLQMPVMDGYGATKQIRNMEFGSGGEEASENQQIISGITTMPIIAMTADVMGGVKERCRQAGMNDFVGKPIDPQKFFAALVKWIKPRESDFRPGIGELRSGVVKTEIDAKLKPSQTDLPRSLPGINIKDGLNRFQGNQSLLRKLLNKFSVNHGNMVAEIDTAIASGDRQTAIHLAHTLKGVSGNIGAQQLYKATKKLEAAIKTEEAGMDECLNDVSKEMARVISGIATLDKDERRCNGAAADAAEPMDTIKVKSLFDEIEALLEDDDTEAGRKLLQLKAGLKGSAVEDELISMELSLGKYNFEEALKVLYRIRKKLGNGD